MLNISKFGGNHSIGLVCGIPTMFKTQNFEKALLRQQLLLDTAQNLISSRSFSGEQVLKAWWKSLHGLVCGTPTRFKTEKYEKALPSQQLLPDTAQSLINSRSFSG